MTPSGPELDRPPQRLVAAVRRGSRRGSSGRRARPGAAAAATGRPPAAAASRDRRRRPAAVDAPPAPAARVDGREHGSTGSLAGEVSRRPAPGRTARGTGCAATSPAVGVELALGAEALLELRDQLLGAVAAAGDVVAHVDHARRARLDARAARRTSPRRRRRRAARQALADVIEAARADPADALLHRAQRRQQQVPPRARRVAAAAQRVSLPLGSRTPPSQPPAAGRGRRRPRRARRRSARRRAGAGPSVSAGSSRARRRARSPARSGVATFSTRTAQALNSAVPDLGSVTSIVSRLTSTSSGKWNVMNASPGRSDGSMRTGRLDRAAPRGDPHDLALLEQQALGVLGRDVERLAAAQRRAVAARSARRCCTSPAGGRS